MNDHLDLDALCDVLAGVAPEHTGHLSSCTPCRAQLAELEGAQEPVIAALSTLVGPPVPDSLVARLDAALAAERTPKVATATVTPLHAAPSRRTRWLPWAGGLAAACALAVGVLALRPGSAPTRDSSTTVEAGPQVRTSSTGNSYSAKGTLLAQALPQLLGAPERAAGAAAPTAPHVTAGVAGTDTLAALHDPKTLASCLAGLTDPGDTTLPLALDYASFDGQPALVVVYPASKPGKVDVFVVGAGCSQADSTLLFFSRLPRP